MSLNFLPQTVSLKLDKIISYFQTETGDIQEAITRVIFFDIFTIKQHYAVVEKTIYKYQ